MKSTELRIGNYFQWSEFASMGRGVDQITSGQQIDDYIDFKEPIPLTEDWLKKMGLVLQNKQLSINVGGELFKYIVVGMEPNAYCLYYCEGKGFTLDGVARRTTRFINTVHELQNFVYALTGEELTIQKN